MRDTFQKKSAIKPMHVQHLKITSDCCPSYFYFIRPPKCSTKKWILFGLCSVHARIQTKNYRDINYTTPMFNCVRTKSWNHTKMYSLERHFPLTIFSTCTRIQIKCGLGICHMVHSILFIFRSCVLSLLILRSVPIPFVAAVGKM